MMTVMDEAPRGTPWTFELLGGRLCLDFANTVSGKRVTAERERLRDYADLVSWGRQAGAVGAPQARRLLAQARRRPADAERVFREAIALREALYRAFLAFAQDREPGKADLDVLNAALGRALAHRRVRRGERCCALGWEEVPGALDAVLWPVVASAAELLVSGDDLERVKVCGLYESDECGWLFLDQTKSHTRRWCSMDDCGNKAKARRHYRKVKAGAA